uniref:Uncharacterized protein n=1 Tax=Anguilla anguilla TaxID=7936 RepID=A0A0E9TTB9_ANGAN
MGMRGEEKGILIKWMRREDLQ